MEKVFVGIDISKDKSTYIAINNQGKKILRPTTVVNSKSGIDKILDSLKEYPPEEILFAMEVSSNYWENICSYLKDKQMQAVCLNLYQVKKYRQALRAKIKTDSIDAVAIAELAKNSNAEKMFISSDEVLNLKELVRIKHSFKDRVKRLKKSVLSILSLVFPEYTGKKALIKVAVKIAKMMYSMLKSRSSYCDSRVFFQETPILVS